MSPPVPGRFNPPLGSPHQDAQHTQISGPSESVCPVKSSSEIPKFTAKFVSPEITAPSGEVYPPADAPSQEDLIVQKSAPTVSVYPSNFSLKLPSATALPATRTVSSIPAASGHVNSKESPIWNPLPQANNLAPLSSPSVFNSDLNFRYKVSALQTLTPPASIVNSSGVAAPNFNSSSPSSLQPMGRILPSSFSGKSPAIALTQFPSSFSPSAAISDDSSPPPPESALPSSGFNLAVESPFQFGSPPGRTRANSTESTRRNRRVDSAVKPVNPTVNPESTATVSPPVSFRDVLTQPSPRTVQKSFEDVLNAMDEMPEPTYLDGKPGIRFPDKVVQRHLVGSPPVEHIVDHAVPNQSPQLVVYVCQILFYLPG